MKRFVALLAFGFFLCGGLASAVPRYLVEDSSNVIKAYTEDDSLTAPPGHTAVNVSVIEAVYSGVIYQGGTWVVTGGVGVYTPPTGIVTPIDGTTDAGSVQIAAHKMMDVLEEALGYIDQHLHVWPVANSVNAREGIHWMMINAARMALGTRTADRRVKFMEEVASWPLNLNGSVREYVDAMETGISLPTKDWSWVMPNDDPYVRLTVGSMSADTFASATGVASTAPSTDKLIGRGWINDIP